MSTINNKMNRALRPAIIAVGCVLAFAIAVNGVVALASATPHVGDIIAFAPSATMLADESTRLVVHRQDQGGCVLDLNVIRQSGGSLFVETQIGDQASGFRVHWAGPRTSAGTENCGSDTNLIVDHRDLDILALAAGGYGVGAKRSLVLPSYMIN